MTDRPQFLALMGGLVLGLLLGLVYTWLIAPVELVNTTPALLRSDYRHDWIRLAALAYAADGDLERAAARLDGLDQDDLRTALGALIEESAAQGQAAATMRSLSQLADQLGVHTPAMAVYLSTPYPSPAGLAGTPATAATPSPVLTPSPPATSTLVAATETRTPFAPPAAVPLPYEVISRTLVCEGTPPQLQVFVRAAAGDDERAGARAEETPLPGVVLWLTWPGGADRAVTGLRPHIDAGYADFTLEEGVPYSLSIEEPNAPVLSGLTVAQCRSEVGIDLQPGSWRVVVEMSQP